MSCGESVLYIDTSYGFAAGLMMDGPAGLEAVFASCERERYAIAARVVEFRRMDGSRRLLRVDIRTFVAELIMQSWFVAGSSL
jgi:hypothetical protein